jgi:glycosyltransferase involved in cell wall biosynthesis
VIAVEERASLPLPANLKLNRVQVGPVAKHWWSVGLPRYLAAGELQLFHGTNYDVPLWRRCATVLTIHDLSLLLHSATHEKRSVSRARRRLPLMARTADAIITPTESVRREVCERLKMSPEKVFAVPEAARACFRPLAFAETEAVRRRLGIGADFLLSVGTLEPRKNLQLLVKAFEEVIRARPLSKLQLVIVGGKGWLTDSLFAAIERSPVRERVLLTDYLYDEELRALYSSCRAFVYPSIYEGFGLPPLEAMACGAPVIASRIRALEETTGGAALFFDPKSVTELTLNILELLDSEDAQREFANAGQRRAAEFSWDRSAQQTLQVYAAAASRFAEVQK